MHIMDDDSNRSAAVDETPRTNGTHKTRRKSSSTEGEKDSDSGKENGPSHDSDKEVATEKDSVCEQTPDLPAEKDLEQKENKEEGLQEKKETVKETNANAESTDVTMPPEPSATSSTNDNENGKPLEATSTNNNSGVDEKKHNENVESTSTVEVTIETKIEIEETKIEDCSLPLSPTEEDDISRASSPVSHQNESKPQNEERRKRGSSESDQDSPPSVKKVKMTSSELEERERMVSDYVESASGTSLDEIQRVAEKLQQEISTLNTLARAKEQEWNNIIRVKKIKEETLLRVQRKKDIMLIMMGSPSKSGENDWEISYDVRSGESGLEDVPARTKIVEMNCNSVMKTTVNKSAPKSLNSVLNSQQLPSTTTGVSILKSGQSQLPVMMVPVVSSNAGNLHGSLSISSTTSGSTTVTRVPESSSKDKINNRGHRPILPKPTIVIPPSNATNNNVQNPVIGEGRQGPILDVRSIIADYRSKHPGDVPRRGRRLKSALSPTANAQVTDSLVSSTRVSGAGGILSMASVALGSGSQVRPGLVGSTSEMPDLGFLLNSTTEGNRQETSRPSSADSSRSGVPAQITSESGNVAAGGNVAGLSFKDVLVQFAKMSQTEQRHEQAVPTTTTANKPAPYPEVTLHPVLASHSPPHQTPSSSLLHGILTKSTTMQQRAESSSARPTTFSPTLARLLTAPERIPGNVPNTTVTPFHGTGGPVSITDLLSTSKTRNEITITPVAAQQPLKAKEEVVLLEEEQEDSADRLVIDESADGDTRRDGEEEQGAAQDISPDEVPECQGCHQRPAQFVCAGCGNQWYCSRDCQVSAWDEHSEVCSG